jgi:RNA polymerase sigma factor (sigma-70 family)
MPTPRQHAAIRQVRVLFDVGTNAGLTDPQLLERFATRNGEAAELAFAALVERHGPMVLRVCRGVLDNTDEAHDAFQATFLVLVTRAGTLRRRESLASWLHGVALRVSRCARAAAIRRRAHERRKAEGAMLSTDTRPLEDLPIIHEEFGRLPERYRAPMVLCDMEDRTHEQAARELGWPLGTVKSRLARGRATLRERLTRRGFAPGAASILAARPPALPPQMLERLTRMAVHLTPGTVPASTWTLLEGVQRMMLRQTIVKATFAALALAALAAGTLCAQAPADPAVKRTAAPASTPTRMITYQTGFLKMNGPEWQQALGPKLRPVRKDPSMRVWTAPAAVLAELKNWSEGVVEAPRVSCFEDGAATIMDTLKVKYVRSVNWIHGDDGKSIAAQPIVDELNSGSSLTLVGRSLDQGILVRTKVEDARINALAAISVPAQTRSDGTLVNATIQFPDVSYLKEEGEWLIPNDGILIISLGRVHREPSVGTVDWFLGELIPNYREWRSTHEYWASPIQEKLLVVDARSLVTPAEDLKRRPHSVGYADLFGPGKRSTP